MQALTEARAKIDSCAAAAEPPLVELEKRATQLSARVEALSTGLSAKLRKLCANTQGLSALVEQEQRAAEAELARLPTSTRNLAQSAISSLTSTLVVSHQTLESSSEDLQGIAGDVDGTAIEVSARINVALSQLRSARAALDQKCDEAARILHSAESAVEAIRRSVLDQLQIAQDAISAVLERIRAANREFIDTMVGTIAAVRGAVASATDPVVLGATALRKLVDEISTKVDTLISQLGNLVAAALGALDKVPVSGLPEPMAKPTISALAEVSSTFATQLSAAAGAASTQLGTVAQSISTSIQQGQEALSQQLDTALQVLLSQITQLTTQVEEARTRLKSDIDAQLEKYGAQRDKVIADVQARADAATKPALAQLDSICVTIQSAAERATQSLTTVFESCASSLDAAESQYSAADLQLRGIETRIDEAYLAVRQQFRELVARFSSSKP